MKVPLTVKFKYQKKVILLLVESSSTTAHLFDSLVEAVNESNVLDRQDVSKDDIKLAIPQDSGDFDPISNDKKQKISDLDVKEGSTIAFALEGSDFEIVEPEYDEVEE
ncbi:hypothetical protein TRVA0_023S01508 [Trichomonascus vanleenenianus]|uniref:uncharacterized protein n=1 Tax=Trichomonascus vanleenenianus TaxID=2268995 RepID=UPI003ECB3F21